MILGVVIAVQALVIGVLSIAHYIGWRYLLRRIQDHDHKMEIIRLAVLHAGRGTLGLIQQKIAELEGKPWP